MSPKRIRGAVIGGYQFAITIGLLLAAGVNKGTQNYTNTGAYRIPIALQFLWALVLATGLFFLPESPRWFIMKGKREGAANALATVHSVDPNSESVQEELNELAISYTHEVEACAGATGWLDCFKGGFAPGSNLSRTLIGMSVQMMQQLSKS
jgi:MFS transporter, SP family, sugar:H+ symporter